MAYVELHAHSAFTFLEGASLPEQLAARAADLGHEALALVDRDDLGGHVRFLEGARAAGVRPIVGAELTVRSTPRFDRSAAVAASATGSSPTGSSPAPASRATFAMGRDVFGVVLLAKDARGYSNLSALVSLGRFERPRGRPYVTLDEVAARAGGLVALTAFLDGPLAPALREGDVDDAARRLRPWHEAFGDDLVLEVQDHSLPEERVAREATLDLAARLGKSSPIVVATNHVHHASRPLKRVEDVLRCIKHQCTIDDAGDRLFPNDQRHLRSAAQMLRRFRSCPEVVHASVEVAARCAFRLDQLEAPLPCFPSVDSLLGAHGVPIPEALARGDGRAASADELLRHLAWEGAKVRYPRSTDKQRDQIAHELAVIEKLQYAGYFLILWDVVRAAKERKILVQGRGSAANSAVCYCLGITAIDPIGRNLLFERFMSEGRKEPPDIDLDIEHDQREILLQYVYERYGRDHAAMVAAVHTFQSKQAARDVGRVLGLSVAQGNALAALCDRFIQTDDWTRPKRTETALEGIAQEGAQEGAASALRDKPNPHADASLVRVAPDKLRDDDALRGAGLDPSDARVAMVPWLVERMVGLPRHRAIHTGGFVLSARPIAEVCPVEWASMPGRTILQWEKDDISTLGLVKFDLLGLGMLTVLANHLALIEKHRGKKLDLWELPHDDPDVYDDVCAADTVGVFQIESRAQMNTLPRLRPRQFYDLVVEVALIRPGPIQGEMVHPYLRRRSGQEPVTYLHPSLEPHLARTLGVPLFQEQGMKVAIEVGGFTPAEADELRRAMGHKRSRAAMAEITHKLAARMVERGIGVEVAARIVRQLAAFADYGFPESHAASFALLVYASAYLRHHYSPEFYAAILNAQPMGFYSPASLVEDGKRHGVEVRAPDVSFSGWDCTLEPAGPRAVAFAPPPHAENPLAYRDHPFAMRVGLRYVRGLGEALRPAVERAIAPRPRSIADFVDRVRHAARRDGRTVSEPLLLDLAAAGAFDSLESERRRAVWEVLRLAKGHAGPLDLPGMERAPPQLPEPSPAELVAADRARVGLSPREHPMQFIRSELDARGVVVSSALPGSRRRQVKVAGLVICRQRPPTAKGFVFVTLEDERGMINVVIEPALFETERETVVGSTALESDGALEIDQRAINVKAKTIRRLQLTGGEAVRSHDFH
ncbi:MAG: error-prone DNA polymerase [Polyangiales bacterium]